MDSAEEILILDLLSQKEIKVHCYVKREWFFWLMLDLKRFFILKIISFMIYMRYKKNMSEMMEISPNTVVIYFVQNVGKQS